MAKKKPGGDVSFSFTSKGAKKKEEPVPEAAAEMTDVSAEAADSSAAIETPVDSGSFETPADTTAFDATATDATGDASSFDPTAADPAAFDAGAAETGATAELPAETPVEEVAEEPEPAAASVPSMPERTKFRILVLGDFSGRANRGVMEAGDLGARKIRTVDSDNLDAVVAAVKPSLQLPVDEKSVMPLAFGAMDDFRPDGLLQQIPALQSMLDLRRQLQDHKTFPKAAEVVKKLMGGGAAAVPAAKSAAAPPGGESEFEKMLNRPVAPKKAEQASADALIASITSGYAVPSHPDQAAMVKLVEDALSAGLRAVLRHPAVQGLEGAWRGVAFLMSRLNFDETLSLEILDVSRDELAADLVGDKAIETTGLYRQLVENMQMKGAEPMSLVIGDFTFDQSQESVALLEKIGEVVKAAGISFVTGASARIGGMNSFGELAKLQSANWRAPADLKPWSKLRSASAAGHLGLTAPRFLLRLPYGPKTDAVEAFPFQEMPAGPVHEQYLWGNGAFAVALLIGEAVLENGMDGASQPGNDVSDLPCHMAMVDGDKEMTPCGEAFLSDRAGDILRGLGLIPILSVKNAAAVKVGGMHSLAKMQALAGLG
jgi:type VI secretion system protein ImpC